MLRLKTTASVFSRSISIIPARLGSNYSKPPRTKAYLLKGANFSQPSLYALSAKDTSALVEDDLVTPRPSFEQLKPWTAKRRANAAALKTFLRKHEGASPEDLHRIHRSRGFLQSIQRSGANWQAALATLQRMQAEPEGADVHAVGAAISVCAKAGRWQEAIALLEGMEAHGLEPNAVVFTAAITACGRAKQWKKALELFHTMEKRGLPLPTASFNAAISAAG
jgi:pentatricopeptide repeat protein